MFPVIHQEKFQLRTLPWACVFLFLAYLAVHFTYQGGAEEKRQALLQWYQESGLYQMERSNYLSWLRFNASVDKAERLEQAHAAGDHMTVFLNMGFDPAFEAENRKEGERYWSAAQRFKWQDLRDEFNQKKENLPRVAAGLNPSDWVPADFLSYHFLHESLLHWLVALLILVPFAWPIEAELGWQRVPVVWMLGGVAAGLGYVVFVDNYRPLIGSTPVVSSMIGVFLGLYARKRLPFITLHPKTRKKLIIELPGWVLAPLWLLLPLYEYLAGTLAPHVWVAQLSGLVAGVGLVQLVRDADVEGEDDQEINEEDEEARQLRQHLTSGWTSMAALEFAEAERQFDQALKLHSGHFDALTGLYQVRKLEPESDAFEEAAVRLLTAHTRETGRLLQQQQIYRDFRRRRELSDLPVDTRLHLAMRLAGVEAFKDAEQLVESVLEEKAQHDLLPKALTTLAEAFEKAGNQSKAGRFMTLAENSREQPA